MASKSREEQDAYFRDALDWLKGRHGAENVVYAGIHRDETTPHMYAYVVPRDPETGRLNAKRWLGGSKALQDMQTEYAEQVGKQHGLERGLEGSRSRHTTIQAYYGRVEQVNVKSPAVDVPDPSVADRLNVRGYGEKVAKSVMEQIRPKWQELQAKANEMMAAKKSAQEARDTLAEQTKHLKPIADALRPLNDSERQSVARAVVSAAEKRVAESGSNAATRPGAPRRQVKPRSRCQPIAWRSCWAFRWAASPTLSPDPGFQPNSSRALAVVMWPSYGSTS